MTDTSDDYRVQYHSHDIERGDLYIVVHKQTGEVVSPRPMLREYADECLLLCGQQWSASEIKMLRERHAPIPVHRMPMAAIAEALDDGPQVWPTSFRGDAKAVVGMPDGARLNFQGVIVEVKSGDTVAAGFDEDGKPYIELNGERHFKVSL